MTQSPAAPIPPPTERRRLREAGALTQAQVAERVGVNRRTVRAWETGRAAPQGREGEAYLELLRALVERREHQKPVSDVDVTADQPLTEEESEGDIEVEGDGLGLDAGPAPSTRTDRPLTPAQAFDALYAFCAPALVRQTYLLSGRRELARESVERAFQLAWERWPEVARDPDPAGWVRAAAYDFALSPWHRFRPRYRHPEPPPADRADRLLLDVLLDLTPPQRRTLLLYDGVGLDLPETAAETEASTPTAANRILHARAAVATRMPTLSDPDDLHRRLAELASAERLRAPAPDAVREGSERRARFWTRAAIAFTVALIGTTALTLRTAPTHYEPPVPPGATVRGVPPPVAPGPLSHKEQKLRDKLRSEPHDGPERLAPQPF
ncbi:helix-turn-helix domain-containing protein [Streptomyces nigra]|uniref:helix-turn-helix domain-containing protein n=1 Tax=Streptomyces nigra TaxID=1827580 RepID=UPI003418FC2E